MRIIIDLEEKDLQRFEEAMQRARSSVQSADESEIIESAKQALDSTPLGDAPEYIRKRIGQVQRLIQMLEDEAWALPSALREEVVAALVYFSDPEDLIPDDVPVVGLLDDAIMLELVLHQERDLLGAYDSFCRFRARLGVRPDDPRERRNWSAALTDKRQQLLGGLQHANK